jgi:hypothetical protein
VVRHRGVRHAAVTLAGVGEGHGVGRDRPATERPGGRERVPGPERPRELVRELPDQVTLRLEDAPESKLVIAERGEAPVFQSLFSEPFGRDSFRQLEHQVASTPEHFGITRKDVETWVGFWPARPRPSSASASARS